MLMISLWLLFPCRSINEKVYRSDIYYIHQPVHSGSACVKYYRIKLFLVISSKCKMPHTYRDGVFNSASTLCGSLNVLSGFCGYVGGYKINWHL